ncbi:hypothetical protein EDD18DRAFT_286432 [Armillaria luteobubalina]|uniref:Uncharacterized protein n=1 Tax=Armillaria luteobubalina TaxID=153913 RepID=A0AA39Q316_9AGAR|nr:hypothetical protein EDD18DRAFT_286432 [Armillaria luteobubalina]
MSTIRRCQWDGFHKKTGHVDDRFFVGRLTKPSASEAKKISANGKVNALFDATCHGNIEGNESICNFDDDRLIAGSISVHLDGLKFPFPCTSSPFCRERFECFLFSSGFFGIRLPPTYGLRACRSLTKEYRSCTRYRKVLWCARSQERACRTLSYLDMFSGVSLHGVSCLPCLSTDGFSSNIMFCRYPPKRLQKYISHQARFETLKSDVFRPYLRLVVHPA